jgi:hypothetical protein
MHEEAYLSCFPISVHKGAKALLRWCKKVTEGYPHVHVVDFGPSWQSGLAFCAILHRHGCFPRLFDFASLSSNPPKKNIELALSTAQKIGVPRNITEEEVEMADPIKILKYILSLRTCLKNMDRPKEQTNDEHDDVSFFFFEYLSFHSWNFLLMFLLKQ